MLRLAVTSIASLVSVGLVGADSSLLNSCASSLVGVVLHFNFFQTIHYIILGSEIQLGNHSFDHSFDHALHQ